MKESPLKWVLIFSEGLLSFFYASDIDEPKMRQNDLCLVLLQVPKCFVPVQIFRASPKI